jgi:TonB-linked SusC/RagA family outer membrane protein
MARARCNDPAGSKGFASYRDLRHILYTKTTAKMKTWVIFIIPLFYCSICFSQGKVLSGKVVSADDQSPVSGATVKAGPSGKAVVTNPDGSFSIGVNPGIELVISYVGYEEHRIKVNGLTSPVVIHLNKTNRQLDQVVVTALGISREKKSLGYASQEVSGADLNRVPATNITNALSGKAAGVQVIQNNNFGGSTNVVIRGNKSLTGNNQALFVVDGVPIDNSTFNQTAQTQSGGGYDYGNLASDINPDAIESVNILKGAAATALYGSRAANGAIIITTKKGSKGQKAVMEATSNSTVGIIDKSTWPDYQKQYGAGYGKIYGPGLNAFFNQQDVNGDGVLDPVSPLAVYGSYGGPFDPGLMVYQWNAFDVQSPYYHKATPWVAPKNGPIAFFETPVTTSNQFSISGGTGDGGLYRFSYLNNYQKGLDPNSTIKKNGFDLNVSFKPTKNLTVSGSGNYSVTEGIGRNETGNESSKSGGNYSAVVREWWQTNVDLLQLKDAYFTTHRNVTNFVGGTIDNPYWVRYQNYESDKRNRFYGRMGLNYKINSWLNVDGRISADSYSYLQEERTNNGTLGQVGQYTRRNINSSEVNYDLMLNYNKNITDKFNVSGVFGTNIRRNDFSQVAMQTTGGLIINGLYSISNSFSQPPAPVETEQHIGVNGIYGLVSLGYDNTIFVDVTGRSDHSSTLPKDNSTFFYPSVATSFVFSNLIKSSVLTYGKLRLNYAQVGNSAPAQSLVDILYKPTPFGSVPMYGLNSIKNNDQLLPENTGSYEAGVELGFFKNRRLRADVSVYKTNTKNQIIPVAVTPVTGYAQKYVNAGEVENKGIEIMLGGTAVQKEAFSWNIKVNWSRNISKVVSLFEGVNNLQLAAPRGNVTINATLGNPYGTLMGKDFVYLNGKHVIDQTTGQYKITTTVNNVVGNVNPDWKGGISNDFQYKNFSLGFLIDIQHGGDIFSSDMAYGYQNGLYVNTVGLNDLGKPMRNPLSDGGGIILDGVDPNGKKNTVRTTLDAYNNALGVNKSPARAFVYDASYVKLREASLTYSLPTKVLTKTFIHALSISAIGTNLWIIHKNLPYSDPEGGASAGNIQGYQLGPLPATRNIGLKLKLQF